MRRRPNIVVPVLDDAVRGWHTKMPTLAGNVHGDTVYFENLFAAHPLCGPDRAMMLTGRYGYRHDANSNTLPVDGGAQARHMLPARLQAAGYTTALIGKYMNNYEEWDDDTYVPAGWTEWRAFVGPDFYDYTLNENGLLVPYGATEADYSTDVLAALAVDFVERAPEPWFLWFAPYSPHAPRTCAPRHDDLYPDSDPHEQGDNFLEADTADKPAWAIANEDRTLSGQMDNWIRETWRSLRSVDEAYEAIMDAVDGRGQLDRTAAFVVNDNNALYGHHWHRGKNVLWDQCAHVGGYVRWPGHQVSAAAEEALLLTIDVPVTICDAANTSLGVAPDGASMIPLLEGAADSLRDAVFLRATGFGEHQAIRTADALYVDTDGDPANREFYDVETDPWQIANNPGDERAIDLRHQLARLKTELAAP